MSRRETLVEMLRRYREAQETLLHSGEGSGGNPVLMPRTWNHSFRELERCLHVLSAERPKQTRMLLARYVDPTVSRRRLIGKRTSRGEVVFVNVPAHAEIRSYAKLPDKDRLVNEWDVVLASWPGWVREHLVSLCLDALERTFRGEPFLPVEMVEEIAA